VLARGDSALAEEGRACAALAASAGLGGVMHAGGVLRDATIGNQGASGARAVFAPKLAGLARLAAGAGLAGARHLSLFSSIASLLGSGGQANYVAANASLDAWARASSAAGAPCTSMQWGAWGGGGMAEASGVEARMERLGVGVLSPAQGLAALESALWAGGRRPGCGEPRAPVLTASPFAWDRFLRPGASPLFSSQAVSAAAAEAEAAPAAGAAAGTARQR
jgi:hypothetical protein